MLQRRVQRHRALLVGSNQATEPMLMGGFIQASKKDAWGFVRHGEADFELLSIQIMGAPTYAASWGVAFDLLDLPNG